jgi:hypothetical protein
MQVFFNLSMAFTALGVPVVVWRWMQLSLIHKNGQEVAGKIIRVDFSRERIRVDFTYSFQGEPRQVRASVHHTAQTREVHPRKRVVVVVDAQRPDKAFIRDWMCTPASGEAQPEETEE